MSQAHVKKEYDRVGRSFSLLFNRSTMYQFDHPYTAQSIKDFSRTVQNALKLQAPLVLIMNRDQFFIEDEPLDPRLNVTRMVSHFKKAGVQSLSFHEGLAANDVVEFIRVFIDLAAFPSVDTMRQELGRVGIEAVRINHVIYKKVTADDAVVAKSVLDQAGESHQRDAAPKPKGSLFGVVASGLVMEEMEQALSLRLVIDNPGAASRTLIDSDLASARQVNGDGGEGPSGGVIIKQLNRLQNEVDKIAPEMEGGNLAELAEAVFDMKRKLLGGIAAQKSTGVIYADEAGIQQEANALTDRVFIQLVKDEYRQGAITVNRLAQIIRRLVPDAQELQRLMPALKEALISEGMPLTDYMALIGALGKELQSQGLAQVMAQEAENIGVEGEDLIQEMLSNPQLAAELIYLSAEIRKGTGDEKLLSDLLVDYIERIGGQLTLETANAAGDEDVKLDRVLRRVQSQIVDRLRTKDVQGDILSEVEERLNARMEKLLARLKIDVDKWGGALPTGAGDLKQFSILGALEEGTAEGEDLSRILEQVRAGLRERGVDENNFQEIYSEIVKGKLAWKKQQAKKQLPSGVLNRSSTLFFVEKEMHRAVRYGTPFSIVLFAIIRAIPRAKVPPGVIQQKRVYQAVLDRLVRVVRNPDVVGSLDQSRMLWMLPMTMPDGVVIGRDRVLNNIHRHIFTIDGVPLKVRMAASIMDFSHEEMPSLRTFLKRAERGAARNRGAAQKYSRSDVTASMERRRRRP